MPSINRGAQSLRALAAALLLTSSSALPAVAALPHHPLAGSEPLVGEGSLLQAQTSSSDKDKKKKKKNQQSEPSKHSEKNYSNKKKTTNDQQKYKAQPDKSKSDKKDASTKQKEGSYNKSADKKHDKHYQDGLKKGKEKGYDKGYQQGKEKGYDKGYDKGKQKGKDKAYRNVQREQWKAWNQDQWKHYNKTRRNIWITPVQYNRPFYGYPNWAQNSNWGYNRPWNGGWYNSGSPSWSWWGGQALGWGINALTTALIVNNAVNNAIRQQQPTVVVPNSSMKLYYGSVEALDDSAVTFVVANDNYTYEMEADCQDGLLNGEVPTSLAEAELVNSVCQVAFGAV